MGLQARALNVQICGVYGVLPEQIYSAARLPKFNETT